MKTTETTAPPPDDPTLPRRIGRYAVIRRLGQGATSDVFLCQDPFHARRVAVKRVRQSTGIREASQQAHFFNAEAALVGRLQHPNVVEIFDAIQESHDTYVVMQYVNGDTLRPHCNPHSLLPLDLIVEIGFKCAMALDYVARLGIIHRDIKPANILTTLKGGQINNVLISDFGSAWDSSAETTQVFRVGSLAYMPPEQIEGDALGPQADMYALGAVLYHLIAGRPPFEAASQASLIHQICHSTPQPLTRLRDGVSEALDTVVQHALAKHPTQRYSHWNEFANALSTLVIGHAVPRGARQQVLDSERFTLLRQLEFFSTFDDIALWEIVHRGQWDRFLPDHKLFTPGEKGNRFYILVKGSATVWRHHNQVASLQAGHTIGEMAYLAPSPALSQHTATVTITEKATTLSFTPESFQRLSPSTQHRLDKAFIGVLVRRLHAAHQALEHPRRIL